MSIFSTSEIQVKDAITLMAVSNSAINPSIALGTQSKIILYNDGGDKYDYELARGVQPTAIEWHPNQQILAIGWQNGTVTLWQEDQRQAKEETVAHKDVPVSLIHFNSSGSRMVTADNNGTVIVWRGITIMSVYKSEGQMTHCIFVELNNIIKSSNLFFFGGKAGLVCLADDSKHCSDVCKIVGSIKSLMIYEKTNSVLIITSGLLLVQFKISVTEKSLPDKRVKFTIAGDIEQLQSVWIGSCLIATSSNENMIRMWHLDQDENYVMTLHDVQEMYPNENLLNDKLSCCAYNSRSKHMIAGTKEGKAILWKNMAYDENPIESEQWKANPYISVGNTGVLGISIGKNGIMAVRTTNSVKLISETQVKGKMDELVRILQIDSKQILIYLKQDANSPQSMFMFDSRYNVKSIDCTNKLMLVHSSNRIEIHEFINSQITPKANIEKRCIKSALYGEDVLLVFESSISVINYAGVEKQNHIQISESDGQINGMNTNSRFMVFWTTGNYFRLYDMGRKELRLLGVNRKFENAEGSLGTLKLCQINSDGTKVGILADNHGSVRDKVFVYDLDVDTFQSYELPINLKAVDIQWDQNDPRFFGVLTTISKKKQEETQDIKGNQFYTFFYNQQNGIREQDCYNLEKNQESVFAVRIPHIIVAQQITTKDKLQTYRLFDIIMNDFVGLEKAEDATKRAVTNFSFHLSCGNLDEAYKSVKAIQNPKVWERMAQMSVKTKRLDVAEICIGNMRFARGSKAIRETKKEPEYEAQLAMVAVQLGMIAEAEKLYQQCKRYDLLNQLYQANGEWEKAIEIAEKHDRINMLSTYYKYARNFEVSKEYDLAIKYYELSGNAVKEVPRMYLEADELLLLEDYIGLKKDSQLYKWWGNLQESQEKFDEAEKYYRLANDTQGVIRILIFKGNMKMAKDFCNDKRDPGAYYYLAKYFESQNLFNDAIQYYANAQYYSEAVRLAKQQNLPNEVMSLSLQAPKQVMIQSAIYFEGRNIIDKAVMLYMKGGQLQKALQLAQKQKLTEYVRKIQQEMAMMKQDDIPENLPQSKQTTNNVLQANPVMQQNVQPGSFQDLMNKKLFDKALELCLNQQIPLTEQLVQKMIDETDEKKKKDLTQNIAEVAKKMNNYEIASKMYIQLGERTKAMKALIKLGDSEKVIAFANNARMAEIYILAGNFLQSGEWHKTPELMKHIIQFYNKAKAYDHLSGFFEQCSAVEIDEYRDYEKACAALKESIKHAQKSQNQLKTQQLQQKLSLIEQFVRAKNSQDPKEMIQICNELLSNPNIEYSVRQGDIHAELIEFYYSQKQYDQAYKEMQRMEQKRILLNPFLDQELIQTLNTYAQKNGAGAGTNKQAIYQDEENFQEEEIIDDNI